MGSTSLSLSTLAPCVPRRLQYDKLQADLQRTSSAASRLAQENSALKSRASDPAAGEVDPVAAQQVACQMEALLLEKSKLVQENDRLLRENNGLQARGSAGRGKTTRSTMATTARPEPTPVSCACAGASGVHGAAPGAAGRRRRAVWLRGG